jgi:hypothetical protein
MQILLAASKIYLGLRVRITLSTVKLRVNSMSQQRINPNEWVSRRFRLQDRCFEY